MIVVRILNPTALRAQARRLSGEIVGHGSIKLSEGLGKVYKLVRTKCGAILYDGCKCFDAQAGSLNGGSISQANNHYL